MKLGQESSSPGLLNAVLGVLSKGEGSGGELESDVEDDCVSGSEEDEDEDEDEDEADESESESESRGCICCPQEPEGSSLSSGRGSRFTKPTSREN